MLLALLVTAVSCRDRARTAAAPAAPPPASASQTTPPQANARQQMADLSRARTTLGEPVFFDFDESTLRPEARATLDVKVQLLRARPELMLTIAGHADERGTETYNLALARRRADAVRRYLVDRGVAARRLETMSYGEGRPVDRGHTEAAWARNRRAEFSTRPQ